MSWDIYNHVEIDHEFAVVANSTSCFATRKAAVEILKAGDVAPV